MILVIELQINQTQNVEIIYYVALLIYYYHYVIQGNGVCFGFVLYHVITYTKASTFS